MGADADQIVDELRTALAEQLPSHDWTTEAFVGRTPIDLAGAGDPRILVELEWRRADPSNNTVKIFRHLADGAIGEDERVCVVQLFTRYYDLQSNGVSSKRENAEFVGRRIAETFESVQYDPATIDIEPPKRGDDVSDNWQEAVDSAAERIAGAHRSG